MPQSNQARVHQLLSLCSRARELQIRSPCATTRVQPLLAKTRESPCAAKKTQQSQKKIILKINKTNKHNIGARNASD